MPHQYRQYKRAFQFLHQNTKVEGEKFTFAIIFFSFKRFCYMFIVILKVWCTPDKRNFNSPLSTDRSSFKRADIFVLLFWRIIVNACIQRRIKSAFLGHVQIHFICDGELVIKMYSILKCQSDTCCITCN